MGYKDEDKNTSWEAIATVQTNYREGLRHNGNNKGDRNLFLFWIDLEDKANRNCWHIVGCEKEKPTNQQTKKHTCYILKHLKSKDLFSLYWNTNVNLIKGFSNQIHQLEFQNRCGNEECLHMVHLTCHFHQRLECFFLPNSIAFFIIQ